MKVIHHVLICAFHNLGVLLYSLSTLKLPQSDIWQIKLPSLGKRGYLIQMDVELAAVICAFTASPKDDSNTVYLRIKLLLGRESSLTQKVSATQPTMGTSDYLTLAFQRIRFNLRLHSYLQDFSGLGSGI